MAFKATAGRVLALNSDSGNADNESGQASLRISHAGISAGMHPGRHDSPVREADGDDRRVHRVPAGALIANARQVTVITDGEREKIGELLGIAGFTAADMRVNIEVALDDVPTMVDGLPGISHIPTGSKLRFRNGLILQAEHPLFPCAHTGKRIADKHDAAGERLKAADFIAASLAELRVDDERRKYSRRGLAMSVLTTGSAVNFTGSVAVGDEFTLEPPQEWYIRLRT